MHPTFTRPSAKASFEPTTDDESLPGMLFSIILAAILAAGLALAALDLVSNIVTPPRAAAATIPAAPPVVATEWPGPSAASAVDVPSFFGDGLSGLSYVAGATPAEDRLWGVHDHGRLYRLVPRGDRWVADTTHGWSTGKRLDFPGGATGPDAEGVVVREGVAWVSVERDDAGATRHSILRVPVGGAGGVLTATGEWNLGRFYPGASPNLGPESVALVPNEILVDAGFIDETTGRRFDPAVHPGQQGGAVFLVVVEANGPRERVDAFVLSSGGAATRIASFSNPVGNAMALDFDASSRQLWAVCDHYCDVRSAVFEIGADGRFEARAHVARPASLPNHNFEGFALAPLSRCSGGSRPVYWANDANDAGRALWRGRVTCPTGGVDAPGEPDASPEISLAPQKMRAGRRTVVTVRVPGGDGGRVDLAFGTLRSSALVRDGVARVPLESLRTAGVRSWAAAWRRDDARARGEGSLRVWKARTTLRVLSPAKPVRAGRPVVIRAAASAGEARPGTEIVVRRGQRTLTAHVTASRFVRGEPVRLRVVVPTAQRGLRDKGAKVLRISHRATAHTTGAAVRVRVRTL